MSLYLKVGVCLCQLASEVGQQDIMWNHGVASVGCCLGRLLLKKTEQQGRLHNLYGTTNYKAWLLGCGFGGREEHALNAYVYVL